MVRGRSRSNNGHSITKVDPIIQTRGMKAKSLKTFGQSSIDTNVEIDKLSQIDCLTSVEFAGGNDASNKSGGEEAIHNDGIEISINGSDVDDEFLDEEGFEDEVVEQQDEEERGNKKGRNWVSSKVVKVTQNDLHNNDQSSSVVGDKFSHLRNDPDFRRFLNEMLDDRDKGQQDYSHGVSNSAAATPTPQRGRNLTPKGKNRGNGDQMDNHLTPTTPCLARLCTVKSPDTMIYSPGLKKVSNEDISLIEKISNFVESIRLDGKYGHGKSGSGRSDQLQRQSRQESPHQQCAHDVRTMIQSRDVCQSGSGDRSRANSSNRREARNNNESADEITDQLLVQAEKFHARVEAPKGNSQVNQFNSLLMPYDYEQLRSKFVKPEGLAPIDSEILFLRNFDQDDEFFHVTSEIDPSLRIKIERGKFIDLERLLPKDRTSLAGRSVGDDLNRQLFQLITQGTENYLDPPMPRASGKITNIKKWDQAFRVFVAIYTHANPERASEIWQYVYVIHTTAATNH